MSEAIGAEIEALGVELGRRTLAIVRKGGKTVTIPRGSAPPAHLLWPSANGPPGRSSPPGDGRRPDRHGAADTVCHFARRPCAVKPIGPHTLRHAFVPAAPDAGVPLRDVEPDRLEAFFLDGLAPPAR